MPVAARIYYEYRQEKNGNPGERREYAAGDLLVSIGFLSVAGNIRVSIGFL